MNSPTVDRDSHVVALIRSRQALEADPDDIAAHFNQALTLCQLGQWEEAVSVWEYVLQKEPDNAFAYVNMGIVLLELAQWKQAEDAFTQAVRCRSDHAAAHFGQGLARAQQGQNEAAKAAWEETLRLDPNHAEARYNLDFLVAMPSESTSPESLPLGSERVSPEKTEDTSATLLSPLSSTIASTAHVEYEVTSQISMLPVIQAADADAPLVATTPEENTLAPAENRIKLPALNGLPLDAIAQSVISAQQEALAEQVAATAGQAQNAEKDMKAGEPAPVPVEPTLRMDGQELKKEYRKLRRQETPAKPSKPSEDILNGISLDRWPQGRWIAGVTIVLLTLLLTAWGVQGLYKQSAPVAPPGSSDVPMMSPALSSEERAHIPPPAESTTAIAGHSSPVLAEKSSDVTTDSVTHSEISSTTPATSPSSSAVSDVPAIKSANSTVKTEQTLKHTADAPAPRPAHQTPGARTGTIAKNNSERASAMRRKPQATQAARPHPGAAMTRHAAFHDEDTFPTHSRSGHTDNSDEWTDKIP